MPKSNYMVGPEAQFKQTEREEGFILGYKLLTIGEGCYVNKPDVKISVLNSPQTKEIWKNKVHRAVCGRNRFENVHVHLGAKSKEEAHIAPAPNCGCGLYGFYNPRNLLDSHYQNYLDKDDFVIALVKGWGKTQLHQEGFRCEFMELLGLLSNPLPDSNKVYMDKIAELAGIYNVPVVSAANLVTVINEFGGEYLPPAMARTAKKKFFFFTRKPSSNLSVGFGKRLKFAWQHYTGLVIGAIGCGLMSGGLIILTAWGITAAVHTFTHETPASATNPVISPSTSKINQLNTVTFEVHNAATSGVNLQLDTSNEQNDENSGGDNYLTINSLQSGSSCHQIESSKMDCGYIAPGQSTTVKLISKPVALGSFHYTFLLDNDGSNMTGPNNKPIYLKLTQTIK